MPIEILPLLFRVFRGKGRSLDLQAEQQAWQLHRELACSVSVIPVQNKKHRRKAACLTKDEEEQGSSWEQDKSQTCSISLYYCPWKMAKNKWLMKCLGHFGSEGSLSCTGLFQLWRTCPGRSINSKEHVLSPLAWSSVSAIRNSHFLIQGRESGRYIPWHILWFYFLDYGKDMMKWDGKPL